MVPTYLSTCLSPYLSLSVSLSLFACLPARTPVCRRAIYLSIDPSLQNLSECYCKMGSKAGPSFNQGAGCRRRCLHEAGGGRLGLGIQR